MSQLKQQIGDQPDPQCEVCARVAVPVLCFICEVHDCPLRPIDAEGVKFAEEFRSGRVIHDAFPEVK